MVQRSQHRSLLEIGIAALLLAIGVNPKPRDQQPTKSQLNVALEASKKSTESSKGRFQADRAKARHDNSWKNVLLCLYKGISDHRVISIAGGVTFFALLAIFPTLAALVSIYGLFTDPASISAHLDKLSGMLPGGAMEVIGDQMKRVAEQGKTTLGFTFLFSLMLSLWSANAGMKALFDALNIVYDAKEKRGFIKLNAVSLAFTLGTLIFFLVAIGAMVVLPVALQYVGFGGTSEGLIRLARWPVLLVIIALVIALMYRYGPSRDHAQWHWITAGSGVASLAWVVVSLTFSWYAAHFGSYNKTYGSLGAVVGFMTWIWLSTIVILIGAELDAEMEQRERGRSD